MAPSFCLPSVAGAMRCYAKRCARRYARALLSYERAAGACYPPAAEARVLLPLYADLYAAFVTTAPPRQQQEGRGSA